MIPLLFGVQQIIEGMLWLSFRFDAALLTFITTYVFSLFSHVVWPIFVPRSIWLLEVVPWRRSVIAGFHVIGLAIGLYLLYFIVKLPVVAQADERIVYISPHFYHIHAMGFYLAATCIGSLFSGHRIVNVSGALALVLLRSFTGFTLSRCFPYGVFLCSAEFRYLSLLQAQRHGAAAYAAGS